MDTLNEQAKHIRDNYSLRDCVVGMETWIRLTLDIGNVCMVKFHGLVLRPSYHVPEGRIYPQEKIDVIH